MALKSCRECGKKVSTEASSCPNCGAPDPTKTKNRERSQRKLSGKTGKEGWPIEYLEAQSELKSDEDKDYRDPSEWDKIYGDREREKRANDISQKKFVKSTKPGGKYFFNGVEGLPKTFWGYFIGANVGLNLLAFLDKTNEALPFIIVVQIVWNIFAIMGVFNAADFYKAEKQKLGMSYGWATTAKIASIILVLSAIGNNIPK